MKKVKQNLKYFFRQSLRTRGRADYAALFSRGVADGEKLNTVYPWFYLRVFCALFAAFTVYSVCMALFGGTNMERIPFYMLGGAFLDVTILVLVYELYPRNDISLAKLACVTLLGGCAAVALSALVYDIPDYSFFLNGWNLALTAGISEEITKGAAAIACVIILNKKNDPVAGFLIGAAVGTWFSLTENAAYMTRYFNVSGKILTAVIRSLGSVFSHATWTALICRAFCKYRCPYINPKFYLTVLFCMTAHFCIDMPLNDYIIILFAEAAVCGLATFIFGATVLFRDRKAAFSAAEKGGAEITRATEETLSPFPPMRVANLTAVAFAAALCSLLLVFSSVFGSVTYVKTQYDTAEKIIAFAQNGLNILPDEGRMYDEDCPDSFAQYENGVLTAAEQRVAQDGIIYVYCYALPKQESNEETLGGADGLKLNKVDIVLIDGEEEMRYVLNLYVYGDYGIAFYPVNDLLSEGTIKMKNGVPVFYRRVNRLNTPTIVMICVIGVVSISGACTYAALRRRAKTLTRK